MRKGESILVKDFKGNELKVGDKVVFVDGVNNNSSLAVGYVKKFYKGCWDEDECTVDSKTHVRSPRIMKL